MAQIYHITADIDRVETSVTIAGRRISVRSAVLLTLGVLGSIGLIGLLLSALGPALAIPIGLTPLYLAALLAFVRSPDGRHWESILLDRYRFSRIVKRAVNLPEGVQLEGTTKIINLREEVIPVVDTTLDSEPIRRLAFSSAVRRFSIYAAERVAPAHPMTPIPAYAPDRRPHMMGRYS